MSRRSVWMHLDTRRSTNARAIFGYTVVDINVVISTHFTEVLRNHADEVFTRAQLTEYLERVSVRTL